MVPCSRMLRGTFYFAAVTLDWTSPENPSLWRDALKTLFDPCPAGWRVPWSGDGIASIWQGFDPTHGVWANTDTKAGYHWDTPAIIGGAGSWFPASGYRTLAVFAGVKLWIHIRTSNQRTFRVSQSDFTPDTGNNRTFGFSVRCIRE